MNVYIKQLSLYLATISFSITLIASSLVSGEEGNKAYQKAVKFFNEGNKYSLEGKYKKAILSFRESIKANSFLPAPHYNLANTLIATGKYEEAIKEYQEAIKINPTIPAYHRNLGFAYALGQKGDLAKKKYEELKTLDPVQANVLLQWIQQKMRVPAAP